MNKLSLWIILSFFTFNLNATENKNIDQEREAFFDNQIRFSPNHSDIEIFFQNQFQSLRKTYQTSSSLWKQTQEKDTTPNAQLEETVKNTSIIYHKYLMLRAKTVYILPDVFKEGYLITEHQALKALRKIGIETKYIDKRKFWTFCLAGRLELPASKLETEEDLYKNYIIQLDKLIKRYELRIKENVYELITFADPGLKGNIYISDPLSTVSDLDIQSSHELLKEKIYEKTDIKKENMIKQLVEKNGFSCDKIDDLLMIAYSIDPVDSFERVCRGLGGNSKSWSCADTASMPVRVAEKLHGEGTADLRPEIIETIDVLLSRYFNKIILEKIRIKFYKALMPKTHGFSYNSQSYIL